MTAATELPPEDTCRRQPVAPSPRRAPWSLAAAVAVFFAALIPAVVWPGDITWINDEPRLVAAAWHANDAHDFATCGLYGNFGLPYGPLPTQIYQGLLVLTHDPVTLAALRSFLCTAVTAFSLLWLGRVLGLAPWFAGAVCLAPRVWQFQRTLWDASFAIPLGALALAATAAYLQRPARWRLLTAAVAMVLLPFIHPQDLPLCVALCGVLIWRGRADLLRYRWSVVAALGLVLASNAVYLAHVGYALATHLGSAVQTGYPAGEPRWRAALAPLLGGNLLSDYGFTGSVARPDLSPALSALAVALSRIIYPLAWCGMTLVAWRLIRRTRMAPDPRSDLRQTIGTVLLASLAIQALLFGVMRVPAEPQYFFGSFAVQALLCWLALDWLRWMRLGLSLTVIYGIAVGFLTIDGMRSIHRHGYSATLANQVEIANALNRYSDTSALTNVALFQKYPQSLRALRLLLPPKADVHQIASGHLFIRESSEPGASPCRVELVELPLDSPMPAGATPLDLTPLPKGWYPEK